MTRGSIENSYLASGPFSGFPRFRISSACCTKFHWKASFFWISKPFRKRGLMRNWMRSGRNYGRKRPDLSAKKKLARQNYMKTQGFGQNLEISCAFRSDISVGKE